MAFGKDTSHHTTRDVPVGSGTSLKGQLLIASPHMEDPRFRHSVIMICQHDSEATMGVVINRRSQQIDLKQLCQTLEIGTPRFCGNQPIHIGGPVENGRGFVLHTQDHMRPESVAVTPEIGLTSSIKILRDITDGTGPTQSIISLGYAGWSAGQLEAEMAENAWLNIPAKSELVFHSDIDNLWNKAFATLGVNPGHYVDRPGNA
ncbi:MAG: YqgE/AlgH family protein [Candidatus Puniceispirillum sp.]|jgi:putative transcriptional regulator